MQDHSAGHISDKEARRLLTDFAEQIELPDATLYPGVSYRNILVDSSGRDWSELVTVPPHDIPGEPILKHLPIGGEFAPLAAYPDGSQCPGFSRSTKST